jgi:hypothetical protein
MEPNLMTSLTSIRKFHLVLLGSVFTLTAGCVGATSKPPKRGSDLNETTVNNTGSTTLMAEIWVDNWFEMLVNGQPILQDSTPYKTERSFNAERVRFKADSPATFAFEFRDFMENDTGLEYIGSRRQQMGDGGAIVQVMNSDTNAVVVTSDATWKCLVAQSSGQRCLCARRQSKSGQRCLCCKNHRSTGRLDAIGFRRQFLACSKCSL